MNISVKQAEVFIQMSLAKTFEQRSVAADRSENVDKSKKKNKKTSNMTWRSNLLLSLEGWTAAFFQV